MRRRRFLGVLGGAAGAAAILRSRRASAQFGTFPDADLGALLPESLRAKNILEIFLYGGLSPWETLYYVPQYGMPTDAQYPNQQYYAFKATSDAMVGTCGNTVATPSLGTTDSNMPVQLGPFAARLATRPDVVGKLRVVVQKHALEPHEAAVPQALTGRPVGQPTAAGLGAHVQRAKIDADAAAHVTRSAPYSYVFATGGISSDNVAAAAAAGAHPGAARPLLIKTDNAAGFTALLPRPTVANRAQQDALVKAYVGQYNQRLTWPNKGRVRSPRTDDLDIAYQTTTNVDAIAALLKTDANGDLFAPVTGTSSCQTSAANNIPIVGLDAAVHLLTHPTAPAAYVCVSDVGIREASGGGGYDTHTANAHDTAMNFDNMLKALLARINAPAENDPKKLSLDDTLIILNTEFGRTPLAQGGTDGRNHHPYGYATAFIGGPVTGTSVGGSIGPDGIATRFATPAQNRMAGLLALGIWPFAQEAFAVSDAPGAVHELEAAIATIRLVLGVPL